MCLYVLYKTGAGVKKGLMGQPSEKKERTANLTVMYHSAVFPLVSKTDFLPLPLKSKDLEKFTKADFNCNYCDTQLKSHCTYLI